jgi:hypothetical protein
MYRIDKDATETLLRPKWNFAQRATNGDRKLYFTFKNGELTTFLVPASVPRVEKEFIKVGNAEGEDFVIFAIDENKSPNVMGQTPKAIKLKEWKKIEENY